MRRSARKLLAVAVTMALCYAGMSPVAAQGAPECFGRRATIVGTADHDELVGTDGDDVIVGLAGRDAVKALAGDDLICLGAGLDGYWGKVLGGDGDDRIAGGGGGDRIEGGPGADRIYGGFEPDDLTGGDGNDYLGGGHDNDEMLGGPGDDVLAGGPDFEGDMAFFPESRGLRVDLRSGVATGSTGRDRLVDVENVGGSKWSDVLIGDAGPNALVGPYGSGDTPTRHVYRGLGGEDYLRVDDYDGRALVLGGAGNDYLVGDAKGRYFGGPGNDWMDLYFLNVPVLADGGPGDDHVSGGEGGSEITGGPGDDSLSGGDKADTIDGGPGRDSLSGGGGDDELYGRGGNDELYGWKGRNKLDGGDGDDACADAVKYVSCEKEE